MTSSLFSSVTGLSLWGAIVSVGIVVTFYTSLVSLETSKCSIGTISTNLLDVTCNNSNVHVAEFFLGRTAGCGVDGHVSDVRCCWGPHRDYCNGV